MSVRACVFACGVCACCVSCGLALAHAHMTKCGGVTCPPGLLLYSSKITTSGLMFLRVLYGHSKLIETLLIKVNAR